LLKRALPMSLSAANPAVMPARVTLAVVTVASARCSTLCVLDAADPVRFLSSPVMIAPFIAAIASAIDKCVNLYVPSGAYFFLPP